MIIQEKTNVMFGSSNEVLHVWNGTKVESYIDDPDHESISFVPWWQNQKRSNVLCGLHARFVTYL